MVFCVIQQNCLISISDGPPAIPQIKEGKVRAIAVTGSARSPELPDVPSMAEAGYPEVNTKLWSGFFAPASTPPAIAKKLESAFARAIRDPEVSAKLKGMAVDPGGGSSDDFRKMIDADIKTYVEVVKAANLKFEQYGWRTATAAVVPAKAGLLVDLPPLPLVPAKAGTQSQVRRRPRLWPLGPRLRGDERLNQRDRSRALISGITSRISSPSRP
jgi:hypothetical protein